MESPASLTTVPSATTVNPVTEASTIPPEPEIIQISRLDFAYSDRLVLKRIDLTVGRALTLGLVGPNGGGKTTLIQLVVGLLTPTRGQVLICGLPPHEATRCGNLIGYVPQRPELNTGLPLSVRQVMQLASCRPVTDERATYLLESVGLLDLGKTPIAQLSGGQLQRLLIARALTHSPSLLVLDEPTTGIDASARRHFIDLLQKLRAELDLTIILSSHDHEVITALCDRTVTLNLTLQANQSTSGQS